MKPRPVLLLLATLVPFAMAQAASFAIAASGTPPAGVEAADSARVQSANGIEYLSGGVGSESRDALQRLQGDFPLRLVFSNAAGDYFVADTVTVRDASGQLLALRGVGPILMLKLAPGDYTLNAIYSGRTEQKQVKVGTSQQTVNWRW
jgi:hypothetical protein